MLVDAVRWMTYAELADALGIGADSARNLVRRKRWARQTGNDGLARVGVPVEHLEEHGAKFDRGSDAPIVSPINPPIDGGTVAALESHVGSLQAEVGRLVALTADQRTDIEHERRRAEILLDELARLRDNFAAVSKERDAEKLRAAQIDILENIIDLERQHKLEIRSERDKWEKVATAPRGFLSWFRSA
jgi:hypothetical protein